MPNGNGGGSGFDFGGIFDPLLGFLASIIDAIIAFLNALVGALVQVVNFLYEGELGIFGFSHSGLESIWKGLKNIMDQVFKVWVVNALHHLLSLYQKLQAFVAKLKAWLDKLRRLQQLYQVQAMKRFINMIQRIRQLLVIFRILHLKFATKLDNWLAGIEGKLISRVSLYARKTNEIIAWLNVIGDPVQAYKRGLLFGSYGRMLRGFGSALAGIGLGKFFPFLAQVTGPPVPSRPWIEVAHQFHTDVQTDSGDWGAFNRGATEFGTLLDAGFSSNGGG